MNWYRSGGEQRIWYEQEEIENIASDELRRASLLPSAQEPVVDLEKFIESYLHAHLDQYAELPSDVLGSTEFEPGVAPRVQINRELTAAAVDDPLLGAFGRWRATMAHEAAHILYHRVLFELNPDQTLLFDGAASKGRPRLMRCLRRDVLGSGSSDWREVQANRGMAALLMPRGVFREMARAELDALGIGNVLEAGSEQSTSVTARLADRCATSRQATAIRLETLGFLKAAGATELPIT